MRKKLTALVLAACGLLPWAPSWSATLYVEDAFGDDTGNDCRDRTDPCQTISQALAQSGFRDRILVGPGDYGGEPGILPIYNSQQVTSIAGASATIIRLPGSTGFPGAVDVFGSDKAVFGQRGRGFTVLEAGAEAGILIEDSDGVRVEGNTVIVGGAQSMLVGIRNRGSAKTTIRQNRVITREDGELDFGILADFSVEISEIPADFPTNNKLLITDNEVRHEGAVYLVDCIVVQSALTNHGNRIQGNRAEGCLASGIGVINQFEGGFLTRSKGRIQGNLVTSGESGFRAIDVQGGNPLVSGNFVDAGDGDGIGVYFADKPKVNDNLVRLGEDGDGIGFSSVMGASVSGNTVHGGDIGVFTDDFASIGTLRKNNFVNASGCPFFTSSESVYVGSRLRASGNFWNGLVEAEIVDDAGCPADNRAEDAVAAGNLSFTPTATPNPVRFKNTFD